MFLTLTPSLEKGNTDNIIELMKACILSIHRYLNWTFTEGSGIRKQDINRVFGAISGNDIGRDLAWDYLRTNVNEIAT